VTILMMAALLVPFVFSRIASTWRCVSLHSVSDGNVARAENPDLQLRIASYNVAHGRGVAKSNWDGSQRAERTARLARIAELLRRIDADVVVLNEVDFDSSWSNSVNQARYLAEKAGYPHWAEQRNLDLRILIWKWRFGNVVLSKYPITDARVVDLPGYSSWETILAGKKRGITCDITVGDRLVRVIGAHLSHRSESVRADSATVLADIASTSSVPTIVAGDLNSTAPGFPGSVADPDGKNAIAALDNAGCFRRLPVNQPFTADDLTFHSVKPYTVIDWILIPHDWHFVQYTVELSQLSDHRPVYADVAPITSANTPAAD